MSAENPATLVEILNKRIDRLANTDPDWVVFINDHITYIKEDCQSVHITDAIRDRFQYKFYHFLREHLCSPSIAWIAYIINDLTMYEDFTLKPVILIPNIVYIQNLYRRYRTSRNNT